MMVVTQLIESAPHHYEIRTEKFLFSLFKPKVDDGDGDGGGGGGGGDGGGHPADRVRPPPLRDPHREVPLLPLQAKGR